MPESQISRLSQWLGKPILESQGSPTQEMVFDEIYERVDDGATVETAIAEVTKSNARAGDFGVEIAGSMMAVLLAEALKAFWKAYIGELEKKLATKAADLTFDRIAGLFKTQAQGTDHDSLIKSLSTHIAEAGARLKLQQSDVDALTQEATSVITSKLPQ